MSQKRAKRKRKGLKKTPQDHVLHSQYAKKF